MWDTTIIIASVIGLLVLIELLELPDWLGRKLRGNLSNREMKEKIQRLESRLAELERKQSKMD